MPTLYEVLDLPPDADGLRIKAAYRGLARRFHPDVNPGNAAADGRLAEINRAYATLGNPEARAAYDRDLARQRFQHRRRNALFAATSLVTFVATAGVVSLAVRWHLDAAVEGGPSAAPSQGSRGAPAPQSPMAGAGSVPVPHPTGGANWTTYRDPRFAFALRYPAGVFVFDAAQSGPNMQTFVSRDGRAVLRIVTAENTAGVSLGRVRSAIIRERYAGTSFEQTPRHRHWFALAGTRGGEVFLERVTFSCDSKTMHGWQMRYPASERTTYDELAKLVLRNYPHGNGPGAGCEDDKPKPRPKQARGGRD